MYILKNITAISTVAFALLITSCTKSDSSDDDVTGNWIRRSDFEGVARSEGSSFVIGNMAYVTTGYDGTNRLKDLWQYDPAQNSWTQKADLPGTARSSAVGFAIGDKGYIGTGYDNTATKLKDFWEYNSVTNAWLQKADFGGSARYDAVGFAISGKGYISTGYDGNYLKDLWEYTPGATSADPGTWAVKISMGGSKRAGAVAVVYNNRGYIFSGNNNGSSTDVNDLWEFDPTAATPWTEKRKISNASDDDYDDNYAIIRSNGAAFVMNNKAYLVCGENGGLLATTWEYDFATDTWTNKTSFEGVAREGVIGFSVSDRGYILTGRSSSTLFDDIREFHPTEDYNSAD